MGVHKGKVNERSGQGIMQDNYGDIELGIDSKSIPGEENCVSREFERRQVGETVCSRAGGGI